MEFSWCINESSWVCWVRFVWCVLTYKCKHVHNCGGDFLCCGFKRVLLPFMNFLDWVFDNGHLLFVFKKISSMVFIEVLRVKFQVSHSSFNWADYKISIVRTWCWVSLSIFWLSGFSRGKYNACTPLIATGLWFQIPSGQRIRAIGEPGINALWVAGPFFVSAFFPFFLSNIYVWQQWHSVVVGFCKRLLFPATRSVHAVLLWQETCFSRGRGSTRVSPLGQGSLARLLGHRGPWAAAVPSSMFPHLG